MLLKEWRNEILQANLELQRKSCRLYIFGNASSISGGKEPVVIKPNGVAYEVLTAERLLVTNLQGRVVGGDLRPSSHLATRLVQYKKLARRRGIAHTHSQYATTGAQALQPILCFGPTHADYFQRPVVVTKSMRDNQIASAYQKNSGDVIARPFDEIDYAAVPAGLVASHGPFTCGRDAMTAAQTAVVLEMPVSIPIVRYRGRGAISQTLQDKHDLRKHRSNACYGQVRNQG